MCQGKAFELYSVGNEELLKVYKHGSYMIGFMFWKGDKKIRKGGKDYIYSFSPSKYLLHTYYMPGIFLELGIQHCNSKKFLPFKWWRETVYKQKYVYHSGSDKCYMEKIQQGRDVDTIFAIG